MGDLPAAGSCLDVSRGKGRKRGPTQGFIVRTGCDKEGRGAGHDDYLLYGRGGLPSGQRHQRRREKEGGAREWKERNGEERKGDGD